MKRSSIKRALRGYCFVIPLTIGVGACATEGFDVEPDPGSDVSELQIIKPANAVEGEYIVRFRDDTGLINAREVRDETTSILLQYVGAGVDVHHYYTSVFTGFAASMSESDAIALLHDPRVETVWQDGTVALAGSQSTGSSLWGLDRSDQTSGTNGTYNWGSYNGAGVHAYVVDTGVDPNATEFGSRLVTGEWSVTSSGGSCNPAAGASNAYSASSTNSASLTSSNTVKRDMTLNAGTTYTIKTCGNSTTDTYLRLANAAGTQVASNDDNCAAYQYASSFTYTPSSTGKYTVAMGCYGNGSCSGTTTISPTPGAPPSCSPTYDTSDVSGHGSHVAGTVGGSTYGIAKGVTVHAIRVFACSSCLAYHSDSAAALDWIRTHRSGASVVNMSFAADLGTSEGQLNLSALETAIVSLLNSGVHAVAAAGNSGADACGFSPARMSKSTYSSNPSLITVGWTNQSDAFGTYGSSATNYGSCVSMFAPGSSITSIGGSNSGSSMSAPHVAGAVARYLQQFPSASPSSAKSAMVNGASSGCITSALQGSPNKMLDINRAAGTCGGGGGGTNSISQSNLSATTNNWLEFSMPANQTPTFSISGGTGDADLYVRKGAIPTTATYDCRPYLTGNNETCNSTNGLSGAGTYYIVVRAYETFSGVSLTGND